MFAYCLNNPVCFGDFSGQDAVILYDEDFVGHIGALIQDEDGNWWHFYWGPLGKTAQFLCAFGILVTVETWCVAYTGDPTSLEAINASGQYLEYEEMHYLDGDFSDVVDEFQNKSESYHLYLNNCSEVTLRTLAKADTSYKDLLFVASKFIIPGNANRFIRNNINDFHPVRMSK